MKALIIAAVAGVYALAAGAQTASPAADSNKAKQEIVQGATAGTMKGQTGAAAEGAAAAAKTKDMPKALPDRGAKQKTVQSATAQAGKGVGESAAAGSAKAAADTSPRKEKPMPKLDSPAMKEASKP